MAGEDLVELKFRLADGTDIGPGKYSPATTVASKEKIPVQWPKDIKNCPKSIQDVKLIHAGKILENCRALAECRFQVGELPGGVTTMHVVLRLPLSNNNEKQQNDSPKKSSCLMRLLMLILPMPFPSFSMRSCYICGDCNSSTLHVLGMLSIPVAAET
ncbi:membrane-anchored ubiquitin-fold protein 5-like [Durio zibethinus]|uniref:Membrane-anchored ubiquitin-fold protein 5-like n=1 Tax=Durio zibethinus TaxID=66656 RepID=A0A6P5ZE17_DURZI|nr:membrane-anchored ubiquitin-fold protein 5-like [Durio zibethinus]